MSKIQCDWFIGLSLSLLKEKNMSKSEEAELIENTDFVNEAEATELSSTTEPVSELDQLRNIVFGSAKVDLDNRILELREEMRAGFDQATKELKQQVSELQSMLQSSVSTLEESIAQVDSHYEYKTSEIEQSAQKLDQEVEENNVSSKQGDDALHKRIDDEVRTLTDKHTQKHNQTIDLLNQMKQELNSSKTDRKTLAKLLATVASNLETEDDS